MDVESVLWMLLALYVLHLEATWSSWSIVCGSFFTSLKPPLHAHQRSSKWRGSGCCMSAVLVPSLLQSMAFSNEKLLLYYKVTSLLWTLEISGLSAAICLAIAVIAIDADLQDARTLSVVVLFLIMFHSLSWYPSLFKVFTKGEWTVLTSLASIATCEWSTKMPFHGYVALTGVIGCVVACAISPHISSPYLRGGLLVSVPFIIVEGACWYRDHVHAAMWLVSFLLEPESQYPRAVWLVYWLVIVIVAMVQAPQQCSVVASRKWFHLVAICLFLPVTLLAPQLMSLSYAIALCVLMVMESMRYYLPSKVQHFYKRFLDAQKEKHEKVVMSHIFLILGCATPLWIMECTSQSQSTLPVFGILVLGVGDSLAAVVGSQLGRFRWYYSRKTIEGSTAMWMGMAMCCCLFQREQQHWVAAVTFTTLLEAFTMQIDNLILPLAGATVILLQNQTG